MKQWVYYSLYIDQIFVFTYPHDFLLFSGDFILLGEL